MIRSYRSVSFLRIFLFLGSIYLITSIVSKIENSNKVRYSVRLNAKPKPAPKTVSKNVEMYLKMREIQKLKENGESTEAIREVLERSNNVTAGGYQRFVGSKGTLDSRLRAIVSYKRSNTPNLSSGSLLSSADTVELQNMENDESEYEEDYENDLNDEDSYYENLIETVIEKNKLGEIKENFLLSSSKYTTDYEIKAESKETATGNNITLSQQSNVTADIAPAKSKVDDDLDMYTPANPSWGIFPRPRNISKAYGGGRTITREEIAEQTRLYELEMSKPVVLYLSDSMKKEKENLPKIQDAVDRARAKLHFGNLKGAIKDFESIQEYLTIQSDYGSDILLELGMALENVPDRVDDARKVYANLVTNSRSSKARRNALSLLQGLDLVKKLRPYVPEIKPPSLEDQMVMNELSQQIRVGLTNEWDNYKKKGPDTRAVPWFEDDARLGTIEKVQSLFDAYYVLLRAINPLKKVSTEVMGKAFRRVYFTNDNEKFAFIRNRISPSKLVSPDNTTLSDCSQLIGRSLNGTWDLMISYTDKASAARRYESGDLRRFIDSKFFTPYQAIPPNYTPPLYSYSSTVREEVPVFWGLNKATIRGSAAWNFARNELTLSYTTGPSSAPWRKKSELTQSTQVLWADDNIMITREASSSSMSEPDIFTAWKRVPEIRWKKY